MTKLDTFDVGDRVVVRANAREGTVIHIAANNPKIGVKHDTPHSHLHTCQGNCEENYGWYYDEEDLVLDKPISWKKRIVGY